MAVLKVGDDVRVKPKKGNAQPKEVMVSEISILGENPQDVFEIDADFLNGKDVVVVFTNGSWAYGENIELIEY